MTITLHRELSMKGLFEIAKMKQIAWPAYSLDQHIEWLNNMDEETIHYRLYINGNLETYCTTQNIDVEIDGNKQTILGIGNLCSRPMNFYGIYIFKEILKEGNIYMGFCLDKLLNYHLYLGFKETKSVDMPLIDLEKYKVVIYGLENYNLIKYTGKKI